MVKYRDGFVSNSSSCSFVIIGTTLEFNNREIKRLLSKFATSETLDDLSMKEFGVKYTELDKKENFSKFYHNQLYQILDGFSIQFHEEQGAPKGRMIFGSKFGIEEFASYEDYKISDVIEKLKDKIDGEIHLIIGSEMC